MSGRMAQRIETAVAAGAAAVLAAAVQFTMARLGLPTMLAGGWALLVFLISFRLLASVDSKRIVHAPARFALSPFQPDPPELQLDDGLAKVAENSRVVRLFDPVTGSKAAPPDASDALYEALATLRRSLR